MSWETSVYWHISAKRKMLAYKHSSIHIKWEQNLIHLSRLILYNLGRGYRPWIFKTILDLLMYSFIFTLKIGYLFHILRATYPSDSFTLQAHVGYLTSFSIFMLKYFVYMYKELTIGVPTSLYYFQIILRMLKWPKYVCIFLLYVTCSLFYLHSFISDIESGLILIWNRNYIVIKFSH